MKTFDIQKFEGKKDKKNEFSFTEKDSVVKQIREGDLYREYKTPIAKKRFEKVYTFDEYGNQIGEATYLLGVLVGKVLGYDREGNIIRERDFTRPNFKFTVEQLAEKMLKDYGIDMYNAENVRLTDSIRLDKVDGHSIVEWWVIVETRENNTYTFKTYRISGTTGELISIEDGIFGDNKGSV
ncbi:hypothetical protein [Chryseobacterium caseinilyticum]|uniref:PepSY domain-containing protein n=1 Tax=Chryseobacterium caseinilyticum TaxID=2771428 RepID=A0ABR8ZEC3_9FLAO|nr:hypothetical protein [Chryseobacterium caseinilyticum]MBD8083625.1 hypothetical protein [Chryseobacterium caseinilyticum]